MAAQMEMDEEVEVERLARRVEDALRAGAADDRLLPLCTRLGERAPRGSDAWLLAHRELCRRVVRRDPWRASLVARRAVDERPDDDLCWGLWALAQSLLGHHRFAVQAYRRALQLAPNDPFYNHNLGHLLDVALDRPVAALPLLRRAWQRLPDSDDVTASYAHALGRAGDVRRALELMKGVVKGGAAGEHHALYAWLGELVERAASAHPPVATTRRLRKRRSTRAVRTRRGATAKP